MNITVLHVLNSYGGGAVISTLELIAALNKQGVKSCIIADADANAKQRQHIASYVDGRVLFIPVYWKNKRIRAKWWKRPFIEFRSLWKTWRGYRYQHLIDQFIREHSVNLVHTNAIVIPEGAIAAKRNNLPHVWHVRELVGKNKHFQFYNYRKWSSWVANHCNILVANSSITSSCLREFFDESKIVIIPNGIDVEKFTSKIHQKKVSITVGMVGSTTSRWKNHKFFIDTASCLKNEIVDLRIYGAIPGEEDVYFKEIKKLIIQQHVEGAVTFVDVKAPQDIMKEIDILFHPTDLESFGRIFIEAMAGGIPIVAVNKGGALEMVHDRENGFLIPLNDIQAASTAIKTLAASHELRNAMGNKGRVVAEQDYSLDMLAERITKLYKKILLS